MCDHGSFGNIAEIDVGACILRDAPMRRKTSFGLLVMGVRGMHVDPDISEHTISDVMAAFPEVYPEVLRVVCSAKTVGDEILLDLDGDGTTVIIVADPRLPTLSESVGGHERPVVQPEELVPNPDAFEIVPTAQVGIIYIALSVKSAEDPDEFFDGVEGEDKVMTFEGDDRGDGVEGTGTGKRERVGSPI